MVPLPAARHVHDFRTLRETHRAYVDKTGLIQSLIEARGIETAFILRPPGFGKSLNLSMLRSWFERTDEDRSHLFEGLSIWQAGDLYRSHFQRYPVIYLRFEDCTGKTFDACQHSLIEAIRDVYRQHATLADHPDLSERDRRGFQSIRDGVASITDYHNALLNLSKYLHTTHKERAIVLIDDYDVPHRAAFLGGYLPAVLNFFHPFFTAGLKGNPHLHKAVLTSVLRVATDGFFSGLNCPTYSFSRVEHSTHFGFTKPEVMALLEKAGRSDLLDEVRESCTGYIFGNTPLYNPRSILSYLADGRAETKPYWVSTSSNDLIKHVLQARATTMEPIFETLLSGGGIERVLDEHTVLDQIDRDESALWSLLVFTGYLKAERRESADQELAPHYLSIPNREVRTVYTSTFRQWLSERLQPNGGSLDTLLRSLLDGDAEAFEEELQIFAQNLLSYHDGTLRGEQLYQGFVIGLLAVLEPNYRVRSNRESGKGRPDVQITPIKPGSPGVVMELKVAKPGKKTPEQALDEGVAQIQSNDYGAELRAAGATPIHAFAVAFDGKQVWVRSA